MKSSKKNKFFYLGIVILLIIIVLIFLFSCNRKYKVELVVDNKVFYETNIAKGDILDVEEPTKDGYIFDGWYLDDKKIDISEPIEKNMTLKAKWIKGEFSVVFDLDNGEDNIVQVVSKDATVKGPKEPTKKGYIFDGWYLDGEKFDFNTKINSDINITAKWKKKTTISYLVEHYLMNKDGNYQTKPSSSEKFTGKIGTSVTPTVKSYKGYTSPEVKKVTLTDNNNNNIVVKYYYKRNKYSLNLVGDNGIKSIAGNGTYYYGAEIKLNYALKDGYSVDNFSENVKNDVFIMPDKDVTLKINTKANKDTKYTVLHYLMNVDGEGYTLDEEEVLKGTTDTEVTPKVKQYVGFTSPEEEKINIDGNGKRVVKYYYKRNKYSLILAGDNGIKSIAGNGTYYYGAEIKLNYVLKDGYSVDNFSENVTNDIFVMPDKDVTLKINTKANKDTKYTVLHYLMNVDGEGYTLDEEEVLKGTTDTEVTPKVKQYVGFTSPEEEKINIDGNGKRVVKYYYERNKYSLNLTNIGNAPLNTYSILINNEPYDEDKTYYYDSELNIEFKLKTGVHFVEWENYEEEDANLKIKMPNNGLNLKYNIEKNVYKITYIGNEGIYDGKDTYLQEIIHFFEDDPKPSLDANKFVRNHYHFMGWSDSPEGEVIYDDATTLENNLDKDITLYAIWEINIGTVEFNYNFTGGGVYQSYGDQAVDSPIDNPTDPSRKGYNFAGWYKNKDCKEIDKWDFDNDKMPEGSLKLYAKWEIIEYTVTYNAKTEEECPDCIKDEYTKYTIEKGIDKLPTPTKAGYTFNGWFIGEKEYKSIETGTIGSLTLEAKWTANTNTQYKVIYHIMDTKGKYTEEKTETKEGTTDQTPNYTPNITKYVTDTKGFETPKLKSTEQGEVENLSSYKIKGDGTTVLNYYVERKKFKVTITTNDKVASFEGDGEYYYEQKYQVSATPKPGYELKLTGIDELGQKVMGVENVSITINGVVIKYNLKYYYLDSKDSKHYLGKGENPDSYTVEQEITLKEISREGYTFNGFKSDKVKDNKIEEGTIGDIEIELLYTPIEYKITYDANTYENCPDCTKDEYTKYTIEKGIDKLPTPTKAGYTFNGWFIGDKQYKSIETGTIGSLTLEAKWTANTNTQYKVIYHIMDTKGKYTEEKTETKEGTTDQTPNYIPNITSYVTDTKGFETPKLKSTEQGEEENLNSYKIKGDGSTVLNYYVERKQFEIEITKGENIESASNTASHYYEEEFSINAQAKTGYHLQWSGIENPNKIKMGTEDIKVSVKGIANEYKVTYKKNGEVIGTTNCTYDQKCKLELLTVKTINYYDHISDETVKTTDAEELTQGTIGNVICTDKIEFIEDDNKYYVTNLTDKNKEELTLELTFEGKLPSINKNARGKDYVFGGWSTTNSTSALTNIIGYKDLKDAEESFSGEYTYAEPGSKYTYKGETVLHAIWWERPYITEVGFGLKDRLTNGDYSNPNAKVEVKVGTKADEKETALFVKIPKGSDFYVDVFSLYVKASVPITLNIKATPDNNYGEIRGGIDVLDINDPKEVEGTVIYVRQLYMPLITSDKVKWSAQYGGNVVSYEGFLKALTGDNFDNLLKILINQKELSVVDRFGCNGLACSPHYISDSEQINGDTYYFFGTEDARNNMVTVEYKIGNNILYSLELPDGMPIPELPIGNVIDKNEDTYKVTSWDKVDGRLATGTETIIINGQGSKA